MSREIFEVTKDRFHLQDPCCYILQGTWPKEAKMRAMLDGSEIKSEIQRLEVVSALERFKDPDLMRGERITAAVQLPESLEGYQKLSVYADMPDKTFCWFSITVKNLEKRRGKPQFYIEEEKIQQGFLRIRGWAVADQPVRIQIFDENKEKIQAEILRTERVDVEQMYEEMKHEDKTGFFAEITNLTGKVVYVVFYAGETEVCTCGTFTAGSHPSQKIEKYAQEGYALLEIPGKCSTGRQSCIQNQDGFNKRDTISEMDCTPPSECKRTGTPEKRKIRIPAKDQHCDSAVQNTGEISSSAGRDREGTDLSELGTLSF